jgi:hypothetical protein
MSASKVFLTIDLDYFGITNVLGNKIKHNKKKNIEFIQSIFDLQVPITVVKNHHEILPTLNKNRYDKIINIDFHSDIVVDPKYDKRPYMATLQLNEGTWANYYKYRKDCQFEWRFPNKEYCLLSGFGVCGTVQDYYIDWHPTKMGYKRVFYHEGFDNLPYRDILKVAFCISPHWYDKCNVEYIYKYFPELEIDKKGDTCARSNSFTNNELHQGI